MLSEQDLYEGEGSSIGQEKSIFHIAAAMASANPMGIPGAGMTLQRHTTGGLCAPALTTHYITLGNALASGEGNPWGDLTGALSSANIPNS